MSALHKAAMAIRATGLLEFDDTDTCIELAIAAVAAIKDPDEGTVEVMREAARWGLALDSLSPEDRNVTGNEIVTDAFNAAIDNLLAPYFDAENLGHHGPKARDGGR